MTALLVIILMLVGVHGKPYSAMHNSRITLEILCYEPGNKPCVEEEHCYINLKLIVQESDKVDPKETIFQKNYEVTDNGKQCLFDYDDSRENQLKSPVSFNITLRDVYVFMEIHVRPSSDNVFKRIAVYFHHLPIENHTHQVRLELYNDVLPIGSAYKFIISAKISCLPHFYGRKCETFCRAVPGYFSCNESGARVCEGNRKGEFCNEYDASSDECTDQSLCQCYAYQNMNDSFTCRQEFIRGCFDNWPCKKFNEECRLSMKSLERVCHERRSDTKESMKDNPDYIKVPRTLALYIGGGMFLLIVTFIITITVIVRKKKKSHMSLPGPVTFVPPCRRQLPNPVLQESDDYIEPEATYIDIYPDNCGTRTENYHYVPDDFYEKELLPKRND